MFIHKPKAEIIAAFTEAMSCMPDRVTPYDVAAFVNGLFEAYDIAGEARLRLLLQLIEATDGVETVEQHFVAEDRDSIH